MYSKKNYEKILGRSSSGRIFAAYSACGGSEQVLTITTAYVVAPVLFDYVNWLVSEAVRRGIKRLYFLARDGFVLHKVALLIKEKRGLDIECRYLYVSRFSSRVPLYGLLGAECMDIICEKKCRNTLRTIIGNITSVPKEQDFLLGLLEGRSFPTPDKELDEQELNELKIRLLENELLMEFIRCHSEKARKLFVSYLEQEGLLDSINFAFVDVGWRGTIQAALNRLIGKSFPGFYFGLYTSGAFGLDTGNTNAYLFSKVEDSRFARHVFNNSIFEVFCAAPHGMTVGYRKVGGEIIPILENEKNKNLHGWDIEEQIHVILAYANVYLETAQNTSPDKNMCEKLLGRLMGKPQFAEAELYGTYLFSDETNEKSIIPLAPPFTVRDFMYKFFVPNKIWKWLFSVAHVSVNPPATYWVQGSFARSKVPSLFRIWYRLYVCYHTFRKYWKELKNHQS